MYNSYTVDVCDTIVFVLVSPAQGIPVNDVEPPPYPMEPTTFPDNPPAYPTPPNKGELSIPPAPDMTEGKFIFVSYSSHDKVNGAVLMYVLYCNFHG